jgi:hypothetical protein
MVSWGPAEPADRQVRGEGNALRGEADGRRALT